MGIFRFLAAVCAAAPAAALADCEGTAFYPTGEPTAQLTLTGRPRDGRLNLTGAVLGLDPVPMTLTLTPAAARLGIQGSKDLLAIDFDVDPAAAGPRPSHAHVTVLYPYALTSLPLVTMSAGAIRATATTRRDPTEPKLSDVYADFAIGAGQRGAFGSGALVRVQVADRTGALIEQASFRLSGAPAWLTVGTSSGVVSGTPPTGTTTFAYSLTAANGVAPAAGVGPFRVTVSTPPPPATHGYWLVGADGGIFTFGSAVFHGSTGALALQRPVVGIAPTADLAGYWLVASDGGIFAFGDAGFHGSIPGLGIGPAGSHGPGPTLGAPIVAMVPSTDDGGYFMVAADGGVFAFGDARFAGSCPAIGGCSGAAVAVVPDGTGGGYWLVTVTGGVYHFGDAVRLGPLAADASPVTSAVRTPDGRGFWVLFADGTLDPLGDAVSRGDPRGTLGTDVATAVVATADGGGYWVDTAAGAVHPYGDAPSDGSMAGARLNAPIIAASGW